MEVCSLKGFVFLFLFSCSVVVPFERSAYATLSVYDLGRDGFVGRPSTILLTPNVMMIDDWVLEATEPIKKTYTGYYGIVLDRDQGAYYKFTMTFKHGSATLQKIRVDEDGVFNGYIDYLWFDGLKEKTITDE